MKKATLNLLLFLLCNLNIFAQDLESEERFAITTLKKQLKTTQIDSTRARILLEISTAFGVIQEIDSCAKYASLSIEFIENITNKIKPNVISLEYKTLKARSIENYGSAITYTNAQQAIDTLQVSLQLWQDIGSKPNIADAYRNLATACLFSSDYIKATGNLNKSLSIHQELKNTEEQAEILYEISLAKRYSGNYGDALEYSIKSFQLAREIKDTILMTKAILGKSFNYLLTKNYPEALKEQKKALRLFQLSKDSMGIATSFNDMGVTNMRAGNLYEALKYHKMALNIRKTGDSDVRISISYNYIASVYNDLGKFDEALMAINEAINYSLKAGESNFIMDNYRIAGDIYSKLGDVKQAIKNYNLALEVAKKNNNKEYQAQIYIEISQVLELVGSSNKMLDYLKLAEDIVLPEDYETRQDIYQEMMNAYATKKNYKSAFNYQTKYQNMSDSVNAIVKAEKITTLTQQLIYENKRNLQKVSQDKELAIKESQIKEQKLMRNLSIGGLVLGLIFAFIFFKRFKEKRELSLSLEKTLVDLKGTQKQLIQSEKMASLGELTAGIAHEIQNPLNFVNNFSEVSTELLDEMNEELTNGDFEEAKAISMDIRQNLEKITYHGKRADGIVKGMLHHSRSSTGKKELIDLNQLADEYFRLAYHGLRAKNKSFNAKLETNYDENLQKVNIIPQDIGRVILNLFTNAFYAVNEKKSRLKDYQPTVSVSTGKIGDEVYILIRDNGDGIPKTVIDKIFQPFFTTKPTGKGTGLGLSMSYDIIKWHQGKLEVKTEAGTYTEFKIILPN